MNHTQDHLFEPDLGMHRKTVPDYTNQTNWTGCESTWRGFGFRTLSWTNEQKLLRRLAVQQQIFLYSLPGGKTD